MADAIYEKAECILLAVKGKYYYRALRFSEAVAGD